MACSSAWSPSNSCSAARIGSPCEEQQGVATRSRRAASSLRRRAAVPTLAPVLSPFSGLRSGRSRPGRNCPARIQPVHSQRLPDGVAGWNARRSVMCALGMSSSLPPTYDTAANELWLSQEAERLRTMQPHPGDGLLLTRGSWSLDAASGSQYQLTGTMEFRNVSSRHEIFVPEVTGSIALLGSGGLEGISSEIKITPQHPGSKPPPRPDGYWRAYITRAGASTKMKVVVTISSSSAESRLHTLKCARVSLSYVSYGPHGRTSHAQHVVLPLAFPERGVEDEGEEKQRSGELGGEKEKTLQARWKTLPSGVQLLPIPTHLLCHLDDPLSVIKRYVLPHALPSDIIALGETPLAIMQGRFRHPSSVRPGWLARLACLPFHPTSSLATACGMQSLIDMVGRVRVLLAVIIAAVARVFRMRGVFYQLAGEQARLIDDVTGTLPPYDQFITLGPLRSQDTVDALKSKTGIDVAIVDVNDLKKCQILAASKGVPKENLSMALIDNPAGNDDEQTPIVLIRGVQR